MCSEEATRPRLLLDMSGTIQIPKPPTNRRSDTDFGSVQGYTANLKKAATAVGRHLTGQGPDPAAFEGSPKTGPYANSWSDTHPQYTVADVHTGGGGAFPHLGTEKQARKDESGKPILDSSGQPRRRASERSLWPPPPSPTLQWTTPTARP